jgi:hypothetical protein
LYCAALYGEALELTHKLTERVKGIVRGLVGMGEHSLGVMSHLLFVPLHVFKWGFGCLKHSLYWVTGQL